jgi:hypothetical protein
MQEQRTDPKVDDAGSQPELQTTAPFLDSAKPYTLTIADTHARDVHAPGRRALRLELSACKRENARQADTIEAQARELAEVKTKLVNLQRSDAKRKAEVNKRRLFAAPASAETNNDATPGLQNPREGKPRTEFTPKRNPS